MKDRLPRRAIARELSRVLNAPVADVLAEIGDAMEAPAHRIGVTGPPGGGKSTLISALAARRLEEQPGRTVAVLAIDPTSPVSGGSILGDRIRMDAIATLAGLFIRSVPSRGATNGLCDNVVDLMTTLERYRFDEIVLETVGIGQSEIDVRELVDTVVLVVPPDAGDSVQAMKAGIIEIADIFVVTKSEDPAARQMASEIRGIFSSRRNGDASRMPPVIMTAADGSGITELSQAIDAQYTQRNRNDIAERRRRYRPKIVLQPAAPASEEVLRQA
jgi:LAO/AO transport system kinase